jgi:ribonuclease-3
MAAEDTLHPARARELTELADRLGHSFKDLSLLEQALCHSSTGNEGRASYERLEFLGDAILGFLVAEELFGKEPPIPEGELTDRRAHIVSRRPLARVATSLGLGAMLIGGRGLREQDRKSHRIQADLVEAVIAAIYLDGGVRAARKFVKKHVLRQLGPDVQGPIARDSKSRLLHWAQVHGNGQPSYELARAWGPDHERSFEVVVLLQGERIASGIGRTKQDAEKDAAAAALELLAAREANGSPNGDEE